jgi:pimeloyl-ACP methyl ester carboxylesterase
MSGRAKVRNETIEIAGLKLEVFGTGEGAPLLMLHGGSGFEPGDRVNALMATQRRLICPFHPGFGNSQLPDWITSVDDIAHIHLALLDKLSLRQVDELHDPGDRNKRQDGQTTLPCV